MTPNIILKKKIILKISKAGVTYYSCKEVVSMDNISS